MAEGHRADFQVRSSDAILDEEEVWSCALELILKPNLVQIGWAIPKLSSISIGVRKLKNTFAPADRLPPEVLALALTFRESERDLISATVVCKYWRRTLVSTPTLWNKIICSEWEDPRIIAPRVQAYLERSGSIPIDVQIHARAFQPLSSHTERFSSLRMFLDYPSGLDEIAQHFSKPTPILETISLHLRDWNQRTRVLPSTFFKAVLSSVRTLTLCGAILPPGPCRLSRLTKFTLKTRSGTGVLSITLLDCLERMPLLRIFEAKLYCVHRPDDVPEGRVVTLPYLEEITITADHQSLGPLEISILPALCLPSAHRVSIWSIRLLGITPTPILPLSFEERLPGLSTTPEVFVTLGEEFNIGFFGPRQSALTLSVHWVAPFAFTPSTFGGVPFGSVRKLRACFTGPLQNSVYLVALLRAMEGLEWLEVERNVGDPLADWAKVDDQAGICPALITLIVDITDVDIEETERRVRGLELARGRAGVPITRVEIGYRRDWVPVGF